VNNWLSIIQDWFYPPTCLLCGDPGAAGRDLCRPCADSLPYNRTACIRCGLTLPFPQDSECGRCQRHPPAFHSTCALFRYEEPVRHLIHALKFGARYPCARLLGSLLADALSSLEDKPALLIPVPLHPSRYRERGFNQATEIARILSRRLQIPLDVTGCVRVRRTQPQAELAAEERARNIRKAFQIVGKPAVAHVAIVDDVVTTGATVNELARVLRAAGVRRVAVWACARA
jgi:ComF family protein